MLFNNLTAAELISRLIVFLIAIDVHEFAHAYIAYRMGDSTARDMGRMTLDPRANINWWGLAMFVVIGFGFLGSAPVNELRMRDRRWGMLAAVAAGPISNLLLALICAIPFWLGLLQPTLSSSARQVFPTLNLFLTMMIYYNSLLFLFNLIPLFPLDGWTVLAKLLPPDLGYRWEQLRTYSTYTFFGLIALSFIAPQYSPLTLILGQPLEFLLVNLTRPILHLGGVR